jgi:hypothetical protein
MKVGNIVLATATLAALGVLSGCSGGDDTSIEVCNVPGSCTTEGGTGGGGSNPISLSCPSWSSARPIDAMGNDVCQLPSEILEDRTLTSDIIWYMPGRVTVGNGNREMSTTEGELESGSPVINATLTINPGTQIVARTGTFANLLITRGSKIDAAGTSSDPIIFSSDDDGLDGAGEWGGIIIHGYGLHNECLTADEGTVACNVDAEGESGFAGGYTEDDDSGRLSYVVLTEGGYEFAPGNEINGLSLVAVGSGTTIDHIQVNNNADDGVEFFGGSVNAKYLVLTGNLDDSVDWDEGFQGNLQYVLVTQSGATEGNTIEADTEGTLDFYSKPTIANATFIGDGINNELWVFKVSSGGFLLNTIGTVASGNATITTCVDVNGAGAESNIGTILVFNNMIANCPNFGTDAADDTLASVSVTSVDPQLDVNYAAQAPEASGVNLDVATFNVTYPESTADAAYLDETDYLGAVDPVGVAPFWFEGWTIEGSL